jgi:hypothetical protein
MIIEQDSDFIRHLHSKEKDSCICGHFESSHYTERTVYTAGYPSPGNACCVWCVCSGYVKLAKKEELHKDTLTTKAYRVIFMVKDLLRFPKKIK